MSSSSVWTLLPSISGSIHTDNYTAGNILPDSTAAPALQASQRDLEKHMRADSLEQKIQNRPKPDELVKEGILEENENPLK